MVAAEAMLHSLPVIATRVGGLQNVVADGETGFLIPPNKPAEIAKAIKNLYENPTLLESFKTAGYRRAMDRYTEKRYVKDVENLYDQLLSQKGICDEG